MAQSDGTSRQWFDVLDAIGWAILVSDPAGRRIEYVNRQFARMYAAEPARITGLPVRSLFAPESHTELVVQFDRLARNGPVVFEALGVLADGSRIPAVIDAALVPDERGDARYCFAKVAPAAQAAAHRRFERLFSKAPIGIAVVDKELRVVDANEALCDMLAYGRGQLLGHHLAELSPSEDGPRDLAHIREVMSGGVSRCRFEKRYVTATGGVRWVAVAVSALPRDDATDGDPDAMLVLEDITERKDAETRLEHLATHDELTGLFRRSVLAERLDEALARAHRTESHLAVLLGDLDRFKAVNDLHGHYFGDLVLEQIGARIAQTIRPFDLAARVGGDEFVVLCEGLGEDREQAEQAARDVAQRLRWRMSEPFEIPGLPPLRTGMTVGIVVSRGGGPRASGMVAAADAAMYAAKQTVAGLAVANPP